eukprot:364937-Chlamydomonas_euryale.AAC.11
MPRGAVEGVKKCLGLGRRLGGSANSRDRQSSTQRTEHTRPCARMLPPTPGLYNAAPTPTRTSMKPGRVAMIRFATSRLVYSTSATSRQMRSARCRGQRVAGMC